MDNRLELAKLSKNTLEKLSDALAAHWSRANPVDVLGDATPARFAAAAQIVADDTNVDAALVLFCPQTRHHP